MSTYRPVHRRGQCASCEGAAPNPVFRMDERYCCLGCADGGPCICLYETDLADDAVDHLGLPFALPAVLALDDEPSERVASR